MWGSAADGHTARAEHPPVPPLAEAAVTALYQAHALRLIRMAHIMLGDRGAAEDVVQEAWPGRWPSPD